MTSSSRSTVFLAPILVAALPLAAATLATQDGLELTLDDASGRITRVEIDGLDSTDRVARGGLFVRDRARLLDVPPGALNLLPNPSFETDLDGNGVPDGWTFYDSSYLGATLGMTGDAFDGARAAVLGGPRYGTLVAHDVAVTPNTSYLLQAMVKGLPQALVYVVWKSSTGEFILYESSPAQGSPAVYGPVHAVLQAPISARLADVAIVSLEDGDLTLDMARMYVAPPQALAPLAAPVALTPTGAVQSGILPGLDLSFEATWTVESDRIDVEVRLVEALGADRALQAALVLPVYPSLFWDTIRQARPVTQQDYSQHFAYTAWGRIYNDGSWGSARSVYPFGALTLLNGKGIAMGHDPGAGPQDAQFFYSTYMGQSFTALVRLGIAAEPVRFPVEARFRVSISRTDGDEPFRSALDRLYRRSAGFEDRMPVVGGWIPWRHPKDIPGAADFGIGVHTWDDDVAADDAASVLTLGHTSNFDYWLPLGDFASEPSPQDARDRLAANAQGSDPTLARDARSVEVSALHDRAGLPALEVYQASWMPGSGWSAVFGNNPDPEVVDTSGNGDASRYDLVRDVLDQRFARAQSQGTVLDGAFMDWFRSWHDGAFSHRREHWTSCDVPLSFDPATLTPALPMTFGQHDAVRTIADDMRARGLVLMARDIHIPSFWASPLLDAIGQEVNWQSDPPADEDLDFFRAVAGRKPYLLLHDADFSTFDVEAMLRRSLFWGLWPAPNWDSGLGSYFWDQTTLVERDRPLYRRFVPMFRLLAAAGWEPLARATVSDASVGIERWGDRARGRLLFTLRNPGPALAAVETTIDLAALGVAPAEVGRVVDLVEAGVLPAALQGSALRVQDTLAPDAVRLYHLHLRQAGGALVLHAVKRGGDVDLTWTDAGRGTYEVLAGAQRSLAGAVVTLVGAASHRDAGAVARPAPVHYAVE